MRASQKGLTYCHECAAFPCDRLRAWAEQGEQYAEALLRLQRLRDADERH